MKAILNRAHARLSSSRYATSTNGFAFIAGAALIPTTLAVCLHLSTAKAIPTTVPVQNGRTEGTKYDRRAAAPTPVCSIHINHQRMMRTQPVLAQ